MGEDGNTAWRQLAGAVMPCREIADRRAYTELDLDEVEWCLILVGWDGHRLPVAVLPLPDGSLQPPSSGSLIRPSFDAPVRLLRSMPGREILRRYKKASEVISLDVDPKNGYLWVLSRDGLVQGWDLLKSSGLGLWQVSWPSSAAHFQPAAMCADHEGTGLVVVGRSGSDGPQVLRATYPRGMPVS